MRWYRVNALLLKYYYITINRFDRLFDLFYWPLLDIFIWGFMTLYIKDIADLNIINFILAGIILWVFVWRAAQDITVFVLEDFWSRNLYNLFSSPMMIKELVISVLIMGFFRAIIVFFFLSAIAFFIYRFTVLTISIVLLGLFVFALSIFAWALGLFISSLIMRYGSRIQVLAWSVVWIIQPFSCVFYPLSSLPSWAQNIAVLMPTTYVFEAMRASLNNSPVDMLGLFVAIVISIIFFVLASFFFYRSVLKARSSGLLAKNE
jgi:ABC-2 type transport system permease protein